MKIFAMYLPQFHRIKENDEFWGEGFTDWVTVKKAKALFEGHVQPKVPLYKNYYDLSLKENIEWQTNLASQYGIAGFGIYHYWFNNKTNILTKPAEIIRDNKYLKIEYFFAWDNGNWKRSWSNVQGNDWAPLMENSSRQGKEPQILIPYILGEKEDWKNHFDYLLSYFKDNRYLKIENKPVFVIYNFSSKIKEMADYWDGLAKKSGFDGIAIIYRNFEKGKLKYNTVIPEGEYRYNYEPIFSGWSHPAFVERLKGKICKMLSIQPKKSLRRLDYDKVWENILKNAEFKYSDKKLFHGGFVSYDDTPRRGDKGTIIHGESPEKFKKYLNRLIEISHKQGKELIFLTAWNEWGEGAYLEPDVEREYSYLEAIKDILIKDRI